MPPPPHTHTLRSSTVSPLPCRAELSLSALIPAPPACTRQMPERRACNNLEETDPMTHIPEYSERILATVGAALRHLCPSAMLVRCGCTHACVHAVCPQRRHSAETRMRAWPGGGRLRKNASSSPAAPGYLPCYCALLHLAGLAAGLWAWCACMLSSGLKPAVPSCRPCLRLAQGPAQRAQHHPHQVCLQRARQVRPAAGHQAAAARCGHVHDAPKAV